MGNETKIRPATAEDASSLTEIAIRSKSHWPYDPAFIELCREDLTVDPGYASSGHVFVAEMMGKVIGFYGFSLQTDQPLMTNLFVDPEFIGKGIGFSLWKHAVEFARAKGWTHFLMDADPYAADKFYYKAGCYKVGEVESTVVKGRILPKLRYDIS